MHQRAEKIKPHHEAELTLAIIIVFELPPSESWIIVQTKKKVNVYQGVTEVDNPKFMFT